MKYPITFKLCLEEAMILEMSLKERDFQLTLRRTMLKDIGKCLVDQLEGIIVLDSVEDVWYLRDSINPITQVGDYTGMDLIARLYGLLVGYKVDTEKVGGSNDEHNEDETEDTDKDRTTDKSVEAVEP